MISAYSWVERRYPQVCGTVSAT